MAEEYRLQLFADEGAAAESTGVTADAAGRQTGAMAEGNGAGIPEAGQDAAAATEETFDSLIAGRYKQDFQNRVHSIMQGRLAKSKADTELLSKLEPVVQLVAQNYGMAVEDIRKADIDALAKSILEDNRFYEEMAAERGFTAEQMRKVYQTEQRAQRLEREQVRQQQEAERQQQWGHILQQAEQLREKYGQFNLEAEMKNDQFARMIAVGVPLEAAYTAMHHAELAGNAMQYAAKQTASRIAGNIAAGAQRPREAGLSGQAGAQSQPRPTYTRKEIDAILARVRRGEKVTL